MVLQRVRQDLVTQQQHNTWKKNLEPQHTYRDDHRVHTHTHTYNKHTRVNYNKLTHGHLAGITFLERNMQAYLSLTM